MERLTVPVINQPVIFKKETLFHRKSPDSTQNFTFYYTIFPREYQGAKKTGFRLSFFIFHCRTFPRNRFDFSLVSVIVSGGCSARFVQVQRLSTKISSISFHIISFFQCGVPILPRSGKGPNKVPFIHSERKLPPGRDVMLGNQPMESSSLCFPNSLPSIRPSSI
jgi:hypothetical protein